MSDVAVFYLARAKEGLQHFQAFAQSLRRHPAGIDYDLILICKGFEKRAESVLVSRIFDGIPHRLTYVDDDIGQDIQAYKAAAARFPHTYACFFNTFSEIVADDWLKKYYQAMTSPQVGLVGATASFESLNNSYRLIYAAQWLSSQALRYQDELYRSFRWLVGSPYGAAPKGKMTLRRFRRLLGDVLNNRPLVEEVMPDFPAAWARVSGEGAPYQFAAEFPNFPNPHIRSNAFMVRRQDMLDTPLAVGDKKIAGCNFESGADGLSARILKRGERLLLVGANGAAYDIPEWMNSGCFRSKDQSNLLVVDNQTKAYVAFSEPERAVNRTLAWGSYLPGTPPTIYGNHFDDLRPLSEFGRLPRPSARQRFLSIVIPTHNRLELTIDAIRTVQRQNYQNWEIAVFDNASNEDVSAAVRALGDDRIRCERSDEFLPVTKSWNRALNMARGEYVTLIGDDDGLAPGFFERILELADRFDSPEVIFSALYQFFHPGVLPGKPLGYVQTLPTADFMVQRDFPFLLDKQTAKEAVASSLNLRRRFMFNMPAFTVRRDFLDSIRRDGEVLHPPFPDYYFANLVLERAEKVVVEPRPIAFQGISTSSFGFTLFNQKTEEGFKVLGHKLMQDDLYGEVGHHLLPGPGYNSQYVMTMAHVARALGYDMSKVDFKRYRRIQMFQKLASARFRWGKDEESVLMQKQLGFDEKLLAFYIMVVQRLANRVPFLRRIRDGMNREYSMHAFTPEQYVLNEGDFLKGSELFEALEEKSPIADVVQPGVAAE